MRRYVVLAGSVALLAGAAPAHATGVSYRTVQAAYQTAGGADTVLKGDSQINGMEYGAVLVTPHRGEYAVSVSATDKAGLPVLFGVYQDSDGDHMGDVELGYACGATPSALPLRAGLKTVFVYIQAGQCGSGVSVPTTGTVTMKLATRTKR